jgi:hypothetical protein
VNARQLALVSVNFCVTEEGGKPKIFINLNATLPEGVRFSSSLLKRVMIVS